MDEGELVGAAADDHGPPDEEIILNSFLQSMTLAKQGRDGALHAAQVPFMYTIGAEPFFDEHTILVLPLLRQGQVRQVTAWINGTPLNVQLYRYPRNRALGCYNADLVGSGAVGGENTLVVHMQY